MARPRTPTKILEARGSFAHDPARKRTRANEPAPSGDIGKPPKHFEKDEKKIWKEIVAQTPEGVLGASDRFILELAVQLLKKLRAREGGVSSIKPQEISQLISCLARLGLTPADRSRATGGLAPKKPEKTEEEQKWEQLEAALPNNLAI